MYLEEFFNYKNQLMDDLLTNQQIVRLLNDDCKITEHPESLVYSQIFPYEYIPETVTHGRTFICCDVDIRKTLNKTYLIPVLYVWVFTHKSKLRLPGGGVRVDRLVSEIAKEISGSRYYGLGQLELDTVKRFAPFTEYQGKVMTFEAMEFNRLSPTGKSAPSNRKQG